MTLDLTPPAILPGVHVSLAGDMPPDDFDLVLEALVQAAAALTFTIAALTADRTAALEHPQ
jgi:hypothetical protein